MIRRYFLEGRQMMDLRGRCAVVVGTRRIGREMALRLAALGMEVGVVYRGSRDEALALASEVQGLRSALADERAGNDAKAGAALADLNAERLSSQERSRRLEDLLERESYDAAAGRFVKSYAKPEVLEPRV